MHQQRAPVLAVEKRFSLESSRSNKMLMRCHNRDQLLQANRYTCPRGKVVCSSLVKHPRTRFGSPFPAAAAQAASSKSWRLASPLPHRAAAASTDTMVNSEAPAASNTQQADVLIVGGMMVLQFTFNCRACVCFLCASCFDIIPRCITPHIPACV